MCGRAFVSVHCDQVARLLCIVIFTIHFFACAFWRVKVAPRPPPRAHAREREHANTHKHPRTHTHGRKSRSLPAALKRQLCSPLGWGERTNFFRLHLVAFRYVVFPCIDPISSASLHSCVLILSALGTRTHAYATSAAYNILFRMGDYTRISPFQAIELFCLHDWVNQQLAILDF